MYIRICMYIYRYVHRYVYIYIYLATVDCRKGEASVDDFLTNNAETEATVDCRSPQFPLAFARHLAGTGDS